MESFAIEIYQPGVTDVSARQLADDVRRTVAAMANDGLGVRFRGCTLLPGDEVCFIRVEAEGLAAVEAVVSRIGLDDARVIRMMDIVET
jgi:hypothetical protein